MPKRDHAAMAALRAPDYELDYVHLDAFAGRPQSAQETAGFWPAWFAAFPEMDFEIARTIAGAQRVLL